MGNQTALYAQHVAAGARVVDFGGWDMPLHYGSQLDEHHAVRAAAGIFDVSHMTVVDVVGADAPAYLRRLLANDVGKLEEVGRGIYGCMLNADGGIVDDLITYRIGAHDYRLVVNAATRDKDLAWLNKTAAEFNVHINERADTVMLAVQGPEARHRFGSLVPTGLRGEAEALRPFHCAMDAEIFIARTGYTGEDGWELITGQSLGCRLWDGAMAAGIAPCGLGARDTLRLEAGLCLYGQDMDESTTPAESNLGWTVAWEPVDRDFIGRDALGAERVERCLTGLILEDRGIMRHGQQVQTDAGMGVITSGGFSPTMQRSIALARVPTAAAGVCQVEIRNALRRARIVRPPFVRHGRVLVDPSESGSES